MEKHKQKALDKIKERADRLGYPPSKPPYKQHTRAEAAAIKLASGIKEMVDLMYQNVTALKFLRTLVKQLEAEVTKREQDK